MTETKKTTTPDTSVGADAVKPLLKNSTNSITDSSNNCNLKTISMTELYDTVSAMKASAHTRDARSA